MSRGPVPELLTSRLDRPPPSRWDVEPGAARRGDAWTDVAGCSMRVPFGGGEHGRLVRAHELMHARVSPLAAPCFDAWELEGLHPRSVECAEEFRVNHLLARLGFDLGELRDGSERLTGSRLAQSGELDELVWFAAALSGTRALADLLSGVRRADQPAARACRELERALLAAARRTDVASLASTVPLAGLPEGFAVHTRALARIVQDRLAAARARGGPGRGRRSRPAPTGRFAPLLLDDAVVLDRVLTGTSAPRRVPAAHGRRVVRPARLVLDPSRRGFDRPSRGRGGVVVVDQSGSMSLSCEELEALLGEVPGALVLGYSHAPGSSGVPNAWVLADRGRATSSPRAGNVGNGVDGPALRFALSRRRGPEPVVWVCDGQVTDSGDHADPALAEECARLALRHGIQMVGTVGEARGALRSRRPARGTLLGRVAASVTAHP